MPRFSRRRRTLKRRRPRLSRRRRTKKKFVRKKKYNEALKVPVHLSLKSGGFPPLLNTKLRFSRTYLMDPRAGEPGTIATLEYLAFSTNSLVNPLVAKYSASSYAEFILDPALPCYMHHDDLSQVYSNYRVNSSACTCAFTPRFHKRVSGQLTGRPTYVTLKVTNELPGSTISPQSNEALQAMCDINSMRAAGSRFLKIDPDSVGVHNNDQDGFKRSGRFGRQWAKQAWSSRWMNKSDKSDLTAVVTRRPEDQQFYVIAAMPQVFTDPGFPGAAQIDPVPIAVTITLEANVTYWRYRNFPRQCALQDVEDPQPSDPTI